MNKIVLYAAVGSGSVVVLLVILGLVLPSTWEVEVSTETDVEPLALFAVASKAGTWKEWADWNTEMDPSLQLTTDSATTLSWTSEKSGSGRLTITEADPTTGIEYEMKTGNERGSRGGIRYEIVEGKTKVTWTDAGDLGGKPVGGYVALATRAVLARHLATSLDGLVETASGVKLPDPVEGDEESDPAGGDGDPDATPG